MLVPYLTTTRMIQLLNRVMDLVPVYVLRLATMAAKINVRVVKEVAKTDAQHLVERDAEEDAKAAATRIAKAIVLQDARQNVFSRVVALVHLHARAIVAEVAPAIVVVNVTAHAQEVVALAALADVQEVQ